MNESVYTICDVYISPSVNLDWGEDWLVDGEIAPGESYSFPLSSGQYDIMLLSCDEDLLAAEFDVTIFN